MLLSKAPKIATQKFTFNAKIYILFEYLKYVCSCRWTQNWMVIDGPGETAAFNIVAVIDRGNKDSLWILHLGDPWAGDSSKSTWGPLFRGHFTFRFLRQFYQIHKVILRNDMSSLGATFTSDYLFSLRQIVFDKLYNLPSGILNVGGCRWSYVVCVGGLIFVVCVGGLFLRCRWPYFCCMCRWSYFCCRCRWSFLLKV